MGRKQFLQDNPGSDRISNLPSNVTEHILECLPLYDVVRMSSLSQYWRYQWALLPELILDSNFFGVLLDRSVDDRLQSAYLNIVNNVLLRHIGPIHKFFLHVPWTVPPSTDISHWIYFVSVNGVKDFTLDDCRPRQTKLPSCLFTCVSLTKLELRDCALCVLPPTFSGLPLLTSLTLHLPGPEILEFNPFQILTSRCPQLVSLELVVIEPVEKKGLTIHAPKLRDLVVYGMVSYIDLKESLNINMLSIDVVWRLKKEVNKFFCYLSNLDSLILGDSFWKNCDGEDPPKVTNKLGQLTTLRLVKIPVNCHWAVSLAFNLFANSPRLQSLEMEASCYYCKDCEDTFQIKQDCSLQCLKNVALVCIVNSSHDLQVIKLLLGCSPVLEVMTIGLTNKLGAQDKFNFARELLRFCRASINVDIILE